MEGLIFNDQHLLGTLPPATEIWDDLNTSRSTVANSNRTRLQPDGALLFLRYQPRGNTTYLGGNPNSFSWWCLEFLKAGMPIIWEAKRPPSRHCQSLREFKVALDGLFDEAQHDLEQYAYFVFRNHPEQEFLILLAVVGERWSMRRARRSEFVARPTSDLRARGRNHDSALDAHHAPRVERRRRPDAPDGSISENSGDENEVEDLGEGYIDDQEVVRGRQDSNSLDIERPSDVSDISADLAGEYSSTDIHLYWTHFMSPTA